MSNHGRYVMLRKIADGGMAEIFLARQTGEEGFSRLVIVKRILPQFSADPHFRDMLLDEAHIAMTLNHNNVVPVLDLGRGEGSYFLVMDLVDGWDLEQIFLRAHHAGFPLPVGLALYVMAEVCRGLGYAHGRRTADGRPLSIVHRDVSPQNILLSEHGEVKVTDFGIAKALGRRDRTQQGMIKGKLDFMSPEQASGTPLGPASDIFAAGSVLYLLCTGQRPFASPSDLESLARVQRANFVPPEQLRPDLPPTVARIISQAMRANPEERYGTAEDMMFDLEAVIRDEFGSPGQSQLRQWLSELAERDGAVPISRAQAAAGPSLTSRWFAEGEMLSFDDSSSVGISPSAHDLAWNGPAPVAAYPANAPVHYTPSPMAAGYAAPAVPPAPGYAHQAYPPSPAALPQLARPYAAQPHVSHAAHPHAAQAHAAHAPYPVASPVYAPAQPAFAAAPAAGGGSITPIVWDAPGNAATFGRDPTNPHGRGFRGTATRARRGRWGTRTVSAELPRRRSFARGFLLLLILVGAGGFVASQVLSPEQQAALIADGRTLIERGQNEVTSAIARFRAKDAPAGVGLERATMPTGLGERSAIAGPGTAVPVKETRP
ncbi:MAG TPA: serine/threonine-protein kinase [Polyangia bacterium]